MTKNRGRVRRVAARPPRNSLPPGFDPEGVKDGYYVVYHGRTGYIDEAELLTQSGLGFYGGGHSAWELAHGTNPTVTTSEEYAKTYAEGAFGPQTGIVLEYRIPLHHLAEYLWPADQNEGWRPNQKVYAHALRKYLPQAWLRDIKDVGKL